MNCTEFEDLMLEAADERRELSGDLRTHLAECDHCRDWWRSQRLLADAIAEWRQSVPQVEFAERVAQAALRESPLSVTDKPIRSRRARQHAGVVAVAVVVMLLAVVLTSRLPVSDHDRAIDADQTVSTETATLPNAELADAAAATSDAGPATTGEDASWWSMARDAVEPPRVVALLVPSAASDADESIETLLPSLPETRLDEWRESVAPIGSRIGSAFGFLRTALPDGAPAG